MNSNYRLLLAALITLLAICGQVVFGWVCTGKHPTRLFGS